MSGAAPQMCPCGHVPVEMCGPLCLFRRDPLTGGAAFAVRELCDSFLVGPSGEKLQNLGAVCRRYLKAYGLTGGSS